MLNKTRYNLIATLCLYMVNNFSCCGQIYSHSVEYENICKSIQKVNLGKYGCDYKIVNRIGANKKIKESCIIIPNKGTLKIVYSYNENGDKTREDISYKSRTLTIEHKYKYKFVRSVYNSLSYNKIIEQTTTINFSNPIIVKSILGGNSYESVKSQLRYLKQEKDRAIFQLLDEYPKSDLYSLPICNCKNSFQSELIDQIYDYKLIQVNDNEGISLGLGRRNGTLHYIYKSDINGIPRLERIEFSYKQSQYLVEKYKYIN